jgi:hypothetical protein
MDPNDWDFFEEQIATLILIESVEFPDAIRDACRKHPNKSVDTLVLAAISFVTHLENHSLLVEDVTPVQSLRRYHVIAALAPNVALLTSEGRTCKDVHHFWKTTKSEVFS